jgi:hypothetical protein
VQVAAVLIDSARRGGLNCCCFQKPQKRFKNQSAKCKIVGPLRGDCFMSRRQQQQNLKVVCFNCEGKMER